MNEEIESPEEMSDDTLEFSLSVDVNLAGHDPEQIKVILENAIHQLMGDLLCIPGTGASIVDYNLN